jgi:hypothetical protein
MTNHKAERRALLLLAIGSVIGIVSGVTVAFRDPGRAPRVLPDDAIALVNGRAIREEEYARALALLAADKRTEITDADRAHVLNRFIEEELLVQGGITIGLVHSHPAVRQAMTRAMLASIVAESTSEQPSEDVLRTFYAENPTVFVRPLHTRTAAPGDAALPAFEEMRERVEDMYLRRARDDALREYLQWLRNEAKIVLLPEAVR